MILPPRFVILSSSPNSEIPRHIQLTISPVRDDDERNLAMPIRKLQTSGTDEILAKKHNRCAFVYIDESGGKNLIHQRRQNHTDENKTRIHAQEQMEYRTGCRWKGETEAIGIPSNSCSLFSHTSQSQHQTIKSNTPESSRSFLVSFNPGALRRQSNLATFHGENNGEPRLSALFNLFLPCRQCHVVSRCAETAGQKVVNDWTCLFVEFSVSDAAFIYWFSRREQTRPIPRATSCGLCKTTHVNTHVIWLV